MLTSIFNFARSPIVIISLVILILGRYLLIHESITPNSLVNFNATVGGRLRSSTPLALPCYSSYDGRAVSPDLQACGAVMANYHSHSFRTRNYGSTPFGAWESCLSKNEKCLLDYMNPANPAATNGTDCNLGSISEHYLEVQDASDVIAAFSFSKLTGTPLSIRNTGHDTSGRSTMKGSLALWMRNLNSLSYHEAFVPTGCAQGTPSQAITAGTGATLIDVYRFADKHKVTAIGGFSSSVAWHGGWLLGGGFGMLTPVYGMGVDRVLEFKVVTPDGQLRIANQCQNSDLFWALRGGGGGTFGVVLEATSKVEPQMTLQVAKFSLEPEHLKRLDEILVNNAVKWSSEGWGGFHSLEVILGNLFINPLLTLKEAESSFKELSDFVHEVGGTFTLKTMSSWLEFFTAHIGNEMSGVPNVLGSRLIPKENFESVMGRTQLTMFLSAAPGLMIIFAPPTSYNSTGSDTSVTPAWRNSLWHIVGMYPWNYDANAVDVKQAFGAMHFLTQGLKRIAPNSGAYFNEADVFETDFEKSFWGDNYPRLLEIKQKYDPEGLLDCWRCVGWKGPSAKSYECYPDMVL
ncbi:hypothetical protein J3A83DRAFT_4221558 [Scleroderma citrinum]